MQIMTAKIPWLILFLLVLAGAILLAKPLVRYVIQLITNAILSKILTEEYTKNVAETFPSLKRFSVLNLLELSMRAETGKIANRPLGSPKHFAGYDNLMFSPRQLTKLSFPENAQIDLSVTLGPNAEKPLTIEIPLMIGAMAYGLALSEEAKLALARAAKTLKTATNSGEGPLLPEEPLAADKFVLQICRWSWGARTNEQIALSDMLEVQMGQGADIGTARIEATELEGRARVLAGLDAGQPAISLPAPPGVVDSGDWPEFIKKLRQRANGIPIALKLMATEHLEEELAAAVSLGFDVIVIDGAEGGTHATAPIKQDDFGIPSINALIRAKRFLKNTPVSLVIAGGYFTPGQCLKALALGADAIYLATVPLLALAHNQLQKVIPWEPPTTLIYYDSPAKTELDIDQAATSVANVFTGMILEMEEAMRALGKSSLKELGPGDLVALDSLTAEITGVKQIAKPAPLMAETKVRESLGQLQDMLRLAYRLVEFMETTLAELCYHKDLSRVHLLKNQCRLLAEQKTALTAKTP